MKPGNSTFQIFHRALASFISTLSDSPFWRVFVRGQCRQAIILEIVTKYFPNISDLRLAGTRLRDETV